MMPIVLSLAALAAEPSTYARTATLQLPSSGVVRVALPPALVGGGPEELAHGLLLQDAAGAAVPYASLLSSRGGPTETVALDYRPIDASDWEIAAEDAPLDGLVLDVIDLEAVGPVRARVTWQEGGGTRAVEALLYEVGGTTHETVALPHVSGPLRVSLQGLADRRARLADVDGVRNAPDHVPPNVERVDVPAPVVTESGYARYVLRLGGTRTVNALRFELPDTVDVLERDVVVRVPGADPWGSGYGSGSLRRVRMGAANIDQTEVTLAGMVGDTLVVEVALERGAPVPLAGIDVVSEGVWLVARDAGIGPHTLYGGATEHASAYDLAAALPELLRVPSPLVSAGEASPNPAFVPRATREEVDLPGPDLGLSRFAWERPIEGEGWVRVRIGRDVLAHTRPDLGDVRVVDAEGRQVPFLLHDTEEEESWPIGEVERREEGGSTLLRVPLGGDAPIGTLHLTTSRGVFERTVTVLRDAGRITLPLRSVVWNGPERGGTLSVDLDARVGDTLLVRIGNGDDAPLPIDAVAVGSPVWELRTRLPEGGARLVYGAPGVSAPEYDLELLYGEVRAMPVAEASLGEARPLSPPAASAVDKGATLAGVALLTVGLLGMVARTVRGVGAGEGA